MTDKKREELVEARRKARAELDKAYAELGKADSERDKACDKLHKALAERVNAREALEAYDNDR